MVNTYILLSFKERLFILNTITQYYIHIFYVLLGLFILNSSGRNGMVWLQEEWYGLAMIGMVWFGY